MNYRGFGRPRPGVMNKLEAKYSQHLELLKSNGKIKWYAYEAVKLRLADKTFYTCDFLVLMADNSLEMHEVKGFLMDDANVKIKCASEKFPFKFLLIKWVRGQWDIKEI